MNWSLSEYLPEEGRVQAQFTGTIASYISSVYQFMTSSCEIGSTPRRIKGSQPTQALPLGLGAHESAAEFAKRLIGGDLSHKLFQ